MLTAVRTKRQARMRGRPRVGLANEDLRGARPRQVVRRCLGRLAFREPAVQPGDKWFAELDEGRADPVIAGAMDEQNAEARLDNSKPC